MFCDTEKCKRCGSCHDECPFEVVVKDREGYPKLRPAARKMCIACGHCVAVCPVDALTLPEMPVTDRLAPEDCPPAPRSGRLPREQAEHFLATRRSIRTYKDTPLARAEIERLLAVAAHAPSAHNKQPVHWIVTADAARTREIAGLVVAFMEEVGVFPGIIKHWRKGEDRVLRGAPHVAVATAPVDGLNPQEDCCCAAAYLELAAHAGGYGACWAGFLVDAARESAPLRAALGVPEGREPYAALMLGHAKYRYRRIPRRNPPELTWLE